MIKYVIVKNAYKKGKGVFALRDFKKGEFIFRFKRGRIIHRKDFPKLSCDDRMHLNEVDYSTYEIMQAPEKFLNHSCDPNSITKVRSQFALKPIRKGEEITVDYRINAFDRNKWRCYCGSKNCKGWCISDFFTIPEELQKKYLPYTIKVIREEYKKLRPKAIFFDIDGTILPFDGVIYKLQETCRHFKVRVLTKKEILRYTIGYKITESVPKLIPETRKFINEFAEYYKDIYNKDVKSIKPFSYIKRVFNIVKKNKIKIGIITTKSRIQAEVTLKYYKLPFDTLVAGDDVKKRKPDPESVLKACKNLGINPKDCMFIGDHPFDMIAAKSAGSLAIGTLTGWGNRKNLKNAGADYIIKNLSGLKKLIE